MAAETVFPMTTVLTMMGSVASATAFLTWFISDQLGRNRKLVYQRFDALNRKFDHIISAHNREDDDRFESLSNDIWRIHLRNARIDRDKPPERNTFPRRRYLHEGNGGGDEGSGK